MIARIRGGVISKSPSRVVVDCAGVGYELTISVATFATLPAENYVVSLLVHMHVREDQILLFGFMNQAEKSMFEKLLSISGIGPKLAITMLSGIASDQLARAIRSGDFATLTKIPGVGRKTAERVVLELKDKVQDAALDVMQVSTISGAAQDVVSALVNLGYGRPVAQKAVDTVVGDAGTDDFERLFRASMAAIR